MTDPHHARDEYERAAILVMDELALPNHPRAREMIEYLAALIRRAVERNDPRLRTIRLGRGSPQQFEELAAGVRLWRAASGEPVAIEIDGEVENDAG